MSVVRLTCASVLLVAVSLSLLADEAVDPDRVAVPQPRPGIGELLLGGPLTDIDGLEHTVAGRTVVVLTSPSCPLSMKYGPVIGRLSQRARVVLVGVEGDGKAEDLRAFVKQHQIRGIVVHDPKRALAARLGATTTTEVYLVDARGTLVYRGAIDDQYGIGYAREAPRRTYLEDALKALAADGKPPVATTSAPGCKLGLASQQPTPEAAPTWYGTVERIVQRKCQSCHRAGGPAPFELTEAKHLISRKAMLAWTIRDEVMPPWGARRGLGHWANDASLGDREKKALLSWLGQERPPLGEPRLGPAPRKWPAKARWGIEPDHVFRIPEPVEVKAEGQMPYVNVRVKVPFEKDRWIDAWQVRPTAPAVVHHVLIYVVKPGDPLSVGGGGQLAAYAPGSTHIVCPEGLAKKIPAGCELHFQIHYTPIGKAQTDQLELAVRFCRKPPRHELVTLMAAQTQLRIPAGAKAHKERATITLEADAVLLAFAPHMHFRGKSMSYELIEGERRTMLLDVPRYDFNWQLSYHLAKPRRVTKGSKIRVRAIFDNSRNNPANPDPDRDVFWGEQTEDEMLLGYVEVYYPGIPAGQPVPRHKPSPGERWFLMQDRNKDNQLSPEECPPMLRQSFKMWDVDKDGFLSQGELSRMSYMMFRRKKR